MLPSIPEMFNGRSIFVTGGTGLVGKVLVEKMLRSLPGISTIFLLIRPLKNLSGASRWKEIERSVLFGRIRTHFPQRLAKIVVVDGNITEEDFGISPSDLERVLAMTSVVFHCAATVNMNETLKKAADMNVRGVKRMIALCHRMPKLEAFIHCSTAYVNVDKQGAKIEEKVYPSDFDADKLLTAIENLDDAQADFISSLLTKKLYNTYCLTKTMGEQIVKSETELPAIIFRPSIILSVWKDGLPGWVDAFQGITALIGAMYTGAIPRVPILSHNPKAILDCVPVDVVVSMMIVCAGYRMNEHTETVPVFHCCTSELSPFSMLKQLTIAHKYAMEYPAEKFLSSPSFNLGGCQCVESFRHKMRIGCMGPVLDKLTMLFRQQPFWTRLYGKVGYAYTALLPFTRHYYFASTGMLKLIEMMSEEDRHTFDFDVRKINWTEYACNGMLGLKIFLMKDDVSTDAAIRRTKIRLLSHQLISLLPVFIIFYMISVAVSRSFTAWQILLPLMLIATLFSLKGWCTCTKIKPLEEYREEIEKITGEPLRSKKDKLLIA